MINFAIPTHHILHMGCKVKCEMNAVLFLLDCSLSETFACNLTASLSFSALKGRAGHVLSDVEKLYIVRLAYR